jgi:heavy metal translocating P-type ATPase
MVFEVAHSVRGRLRVRSSGPRLAERLPAIESHLRTVRGVREVTSRALTGSLVIRYDPGRVSEAGLLAALTTLVGNGGPGCAPAVAPDGAPASREAGSRATLLAVVAHASVLGLTFLPVPASVMAALTLAAGLPSLTRAVGALATRGWLSVDVLEALAIALLIARRNHRAAALLPWLLSLGDFVLERTVTRVRRSLQRFLAPPHQTVRRLEGRDEARVPVTALRAGDLIILGAGERVPADGVVVAGEALVDQQTITGEGLPVERGAADPVHASTVVEDGEIRVRVDRVGRETTVGRIIEAIETAAAEKPELQIVAEMLADRLVGRTLALAAAGAVVTRRIDAGVAILVADHAMAARVGVPTAVLSATIRASREGILIKGPRVIEQLARVDTVVFDKTGTLTRGVPQVGRIVAYDPMVRDDDVVRLAATAERGFRHPVARAITRVAEAREILVAEGTGGEVRLGLGVQIRVDGVPVLVGSRRLMESQGIRLDRARADERLGHETGGSPTFVAAGGQLVGLLVLYDELRPDAREAVAALRARGMRNVIMVTGDHPEPTRVIASSLGLRHYHSDVLPEDKAVLIRGLRSEGRVVAMVGDGVNDALALREADVGIAVQGGVEVVTEAAGVVLLRGGLDKVVQSLDLARDGIAAVRRAMDAAVKGNIAAVALASLGVTGPFLSILVSNGAAVLAALTALRAPAASPVERPAPVPAGEPVSAGA